MEKENKDKPLASTEKIAVWPHQETSKGVKIYRVSFNQFNGERHYVSVFGKAGNVEMNPDNILELCLRNKVTIKSENEKGPFTCTIVNRGVDEKSNQKGDKVYQNHTLKTGIVYHKLDQEGRLFGYNCNRVGFYCSSEDSKTNKQMYIAPEDCFKLLEGKSIFKDEKMASLKTVATPSQSEG